MAVGEETDRRVRRAAPLIPEGGVVLSDARGPSIIAAERNARALEILRLLYGRESGRIDRASELLRTTPEAAKLIPGLMGTPEFKDKMPDLDALVWLRGTARLNIPDQMFGAAVRAEIYSGLGVKRNERGELVLSPVPADRASDPRVPAGSLIEAEINRRLGSARSLDDLPKIRDAVIQEAKAGGWLTKTAEELAAEGGPLKAAADFIKAREAAAAAEAAKKYDPDSARALHAFAGPTPPGKTGEPGGINISPAGAFSLRLGRHAAAADDPEAAKKNAETTAFVSRNFLDVMRAAAAVDPTKFKLTGDIPRAPDLNNPADITRYNTEVAGFMGQNAAALKAMREAGFVTDKGAIDFAKLKAAGIDVRAAAAVAAAPADLKAQAEAMLQGLGELVDRNRGNDAAALERLGIKREDVGAPTTGGVFATSRASHEAVRRAAAILAEGGVTAETLAAARAAAAQALKGGVKPETARDDAAAPGAPAATAAAIAAAKEKTATAGRGA